MVSSKNDFNKAIKLIEDIRADTNNVKSSFDNTKVFNDLDELINDTKNNETTRKSTIKKIRNIFSDLDQQKQKEGTVFQNKVTDVVYYLFNPLGITSKPGKSMLPKRVKVREKRFNEILSKTKNDGLEIGVNGRKITLHNAERFLKDTASGKIDGREFKKEYHNIVNDVNAILKKPMITRSQKKYEFYYC